MHMQHFGDMYTCMMWLPVALSLINWPWGWGVGWGNNQLSEYLLTCGASEIRNVHITMNILISS